MLISQALCLGRIILHELVALLHVHPMYAQHTNCCLKSTPLKDLLYEMIFRSQIVNSVINKTLNTPSITVDSNDANKTNNGVIIYFHVPYYGDKCSLIKSCICKIKSNCKTRQ